VKRGNRERTSQIKNKERSGKTASVYYPYVTDPCGFARDVVCTQLPPARPPMSIGFRGWHPVPSVLFMIGGGECV